MGNEDKESEHRYNLKNKCSGGELHSTDLPLMIFPQEKSSSRTLQQSFLDEIELALNMKQLELSDKRIVADPMMHNLLQN